jgi:alpha-amylase
VIASNRMQDVSVLGLFVDNHDNARFLSAPQSDLSCYKNALLYVLTGVGIPIVYYGTEQAFDGGSGSACRESLWPHYNQSASLYLFLQTVNAARKKYRFAPAPPLS